MSWENVRITHRTSGATLLEIRWPNLSAGATGTEVPLRITNISASPAVTLTNFRLAAKLITGIFTGGSNEQGQEALDGKWIQARTGANPFQAIGGKYGTDGVAANYLALANLAAGAFVDVDVRVVLPAAPVTPRIARLRLGVSYEAV